MQAALWTLSSCWTAACWLAMMQQARCTALPIRSPPSAESWESGARMGMSPLRLQVGRGRQCLGTQQQGWLLQVEGTAVCALASGLQPSPAALLHCSHPWHRKRLRREPRGRQRAGLPALHAGRCLSGRRPPDAAGNLAARAEQSACAQRRPAAAQLWLHPGPLWMGGLWPAGEPGWHKADVWSPGLCRPAGAQGTDGYAALRCAVLCHAVPG